MINKSRLLIFIVAYQAEGSIENVLSRIPVALTDKYELEVLIIDDQSQDATFIRAIEMARSLKLPFKITVLFNPVNQGYGGNQKIGYHYAIRNNFDFVALLHGDGQYAPELLEYLTEPLLQGVADACFGSRMLPTGWGALKGGMPLYKYIGNRVLTTVQNWLLGADLSEFHSGYRVYRVMALRCIPFERNSNVFHFDTEIIIQLLFAKLRIKELPIPTYYGDEICHVNGLMYAKDVLKTSLQARFQKINLFYDRKFDCSPIESGLKYPAKLAFDSTHSRVFDIVAACSHVLDLGSGAGAVGSALKHEKNCWLMGVDVEQGSMVDTYDHFQIMDLDKGIPDFENENFDYVLALDVIEHMNQPENFIDQLREVCARTGAIAIISTANVAFLPVRFSLLFGRFEYGKRGILDMTHKRLFTQRTLQRLMVSAGFDLIKIEGVPAPAQLVFGKGWFANMITSVNRALSRFFPTLFGFQILVIAKARPTLDTLLDAAAKGADEKTATLSR